MTTKHNNIIACYNNKMTQHNCIIAYVHFGGNHPSYIHEGVPFVTISDPKTDIINPNNY